VSPRIIDWKNMQWVITERRDEDWVPEFHHDLEGEAWRKLFIDRCGEHDWYLEIDPYDGIMLTCRKCPAWSDDVYPDGIDLLTGDFEVYPGYVLSLHCGGVQVNGQETYDLFTYGWRGPVRVELHVETYTSMDWIGPEYNVWIDVEAL
jgi:hypothetical protein